MKESFVAIYKEILNAFIEYIYSDFLLPLKRNRLIRLVLYIKNKSKTNTVIKAIHKKLQKVDDFFEHDPQITSFAEKNVAARVLIKNLWIFKVLLALILINVFRKAIPLVARFIWLFLILSFSFCCAIVLLEALKRTKCLSVWLTLLISLLGLIVSLLYASTVITSLYDVFFEL